MEKQVWEYIQKYNLLGEAGTVVVGVSGGSDSLALLHLLHSLSRKYSFEIVAAHVDHMFRGKESEEDFTFVQQFCEDFGILFEGTQINVVSYQSKHKISAQVAARECRYAFYKEVMEKYNASYLALGHHGDDQIETFFMRVVRGTFATGLSGIPNKRPFAQGYIIRPLLGVTKQEILNYCSENKLIPREDPSNQKDDYVRNRFRKYILPFIKKENPNVHKRIEYISNIIKEDDQYLNLLAKKEMDRFVVKKNNEIEFKIEEFSCLPISLQRRVIHLILKYLYRHTKISLQSIHIESLITWLKGKHPSGEIHLPEQLIAKRSYHTCSIMFQSSDSNPFSFILDVPGTVSLPGDVLISAEKVNENKLIDIPNHMFLCSMNDIVLPLTIRTRQAGDRMTIKGMNGTKKVKDIFIDKKIPLLDRNQWPIVCDQQGSILWIPLLKKSTYESMKSNKDNQYLLLKYLSNENN